MNRRNVGGAVFSPNGINKNSKRPNEVTTTVLGMSTLFTGIRCKPQIRSILVKMVLPSNIAAKFCMFKIGYRLSLIMLFSPR